MVGYRLSIPEPNEVAVGRVSGVGKRVEGLSIDPAFPSTSFNLFLTAGTRHPIPFLDTGNLTKEVILNT